MVKTLLMVESWCYSSGILLPRKIRELGHRYVLVTRCPQLYQDHAEPGQRHPVLELAEAVVECDTNDPDALTAEARALHARHGFDGTITSCDYYLTTVATLAETLGLPGIPAEAFHRAANKYRMRQALEAAGLPNAGFALARTAQEARQAAERLGFPLIAKPSDLCASMYVKKAGAPAELEAAVAAITAVRENTRGQALEGFALLESFLEGEEVSVEVCLDRGRFRLLGITDKSLGGRTLCVEDGHMFPADLPAAGQAAIADYVEACLAAIGYDHGVAHVEVRLTPAGPVVVEVNPRLGGNYIAELVELVTGVSPLTLMIQSALGLPLDCDRRETGLRSAAVRFLVPETTGRLHRIDGAAALATSPGLHRYAITARAGQDVVAAEDNNGYLGYAICTDPDGLGARSLATGALARLSPVIGPAEASETAETA